MYSTAEAKSFDTCKGGGLNRVSSPSRYLPVRNRMTVNKDKLEITRKLTEYLTA